ncbi:MAG: DUF2188 domain-containing protein [Coriobacteriia bacterium]|nr:DUF2188 domain-containing protein [Coriobacteriia bacterium]
MYSTPVVQVVYHNPTWAVKVEHELVLRSQHRTREAAEQAGRDLAKLTQTELVVHDYGGKVARCESYRGPSSI